MSRDGLHSEVKRPSELTAAERADWAQIQEQTPHLHRAFFSYGFAVACEQATGLARVALIRDRSDAVVAVLPFQFANAWSGRVGMAERIGGDLSDNCGLIAQPGFRISPSRLMKLSGVGGLFFDHLSEGQEVFGLSPAESRVGYIIEISNGPAAYFEFLNSRNKKFVFDTKRLLKRLEKEFGEAEFTMSTSPDWSEVESVILNKREQYRKTKVEDPFLEQKNLKLIHFLVSGKHKDCLPTLTKLTAGGKVLAQHFGLLYRDCLSYWFPVYDSDAQRVAPGRMLVWYNLMMADQYGIGLIDCGEGDNQWKREFSTRPFHYGRLNMRAGGWRGHIAHGWQALAWRMPRWAAAPQK